MKNTKIKECMKRVMWQTVFFCFYYTYCVFCFYSLLISMISICLYIIEQTRHFHESHQYIFFSLLHSHSSPLCYCKHSYHSHVKANCHLSVSTFGIKKKWLAWAQTSVVLLQIYIYQSEYGRKESNHWDEKWWWEENMVLDHISYMTESKGLLIDKFHPDTADKHVRVLFNSSLCAAYSESHLHALLTYLLHNFTSHHVASSWIYAYMKTNISTADKERKKGWYKEHLSWSFKVSEYLGWKISLNEMNKWNREVQEC